MRIKNKVEIARNNKMVKEVGLVGKIVRFNARFVFVSIDLGDGNRKEIRREVHKIEKVMI